MNSNKKKRVKRIICVAVICLIVIISINIFGNGKKEKGDDTTNYLTYDQVITYVGNDEIKKVKASQGTNEITVTMKNDVQKVAVVPSLDEFSSFISEKIKNGAKIEFEFTQNNEFFNFLLSIMPSTILIIFMIYIIRKTVAGGDSYKAETVSSKTTFADVAGIDEEKQQVEEIVEFLKNPRKYTDMGAKIPKGILFTGEPGTGKTLLAKAIAGEAGVAFLEASGSEFEEKFVGIGASRVRKLFKKAEELAPCIIFIDELDAVAQSRYSSKSYSEQTLNQLLTEMDGFDSNDNIIVIAATNHIEVLDPAILRPGRFDRQIYIPMPDVIAREKILEIHARNKELSSEVSLKEIAKKTVGFSGADLANILNESAIYAVNHNKQIIEKSDIDEAIARVMLGLEKKNAAISEEQKRLNAVHEAGHAIVSAIFRPDIRNFGISIIPRGKAGGYNFFDASDKSCNRKSDMENQIKVLYGGRVAEEIIFDGDISIGASSDLEKASKIAYSMVTKFAMSESLLVKIQNEEKYNEKINSDGIKLAEQICKEAYDLTMIKLNEYKLVLIKLSEFLYEKEYLSQEEITSFMQENLR